MDQLGRASLDWALTHIRKFGDTDIFPVPFEFDAIEHGWNNIRDELAGWDMGAHAARPHTRLLVPKPGIGYRLAVQLDPLDAIIYTGMIYEAAELIEKTRIPRERKIACSYRVELDAKGRLFPSRNGWDDYQSKSKELAESDKCAYVLVADVADFYNQINVHRVRNSLEIAGVPTERAKHIEDFLMNLAGQFSRGIPVGPTASIVLAEACLGDVDSFLLREGYRHTRYVDDFRIFCDSLRKANQALHDLSEYLCSSHGLALQSSKTQIMPVDLFAAQHLVEPEQVEEQTKTQKINSILQQLSMYMAYGSSEEEDLSPDQLREIATQNLIELFDACVTTRPLQQGTARYLLRRATALDTGVLQRRVLDNLGLLMPVMRDAANYLLKTVQAKTAQPIAQALITFLETSDLAFMPFACLWITHILTERLADKLSVELQRAVSDICCSNSAALGTRPYNLLARKLGYIDLIRRQRQTWQNNKPWDRRAVIWAAKVLPQDEKTHWLSPIRNSSDLLDRAVAQAAHAGL